MRKRFKRFRAEGVSLSLSFEGFRTEGESERERLFLSLSFEGCRTEGESEGER